MQSFDGLSTQEAALLLTRYGKNSFRLNNPRRILNVIWDVVKEPMFLLLAFACSLYFILGERQEGLMMIAALSMVGAISVFQEVKSTKALKALNDLTEPKVTVIRNNKTEMIDFELLVPGDLIVLEEGNKVPADAVIVEQNDCSVNESVITGESVPVFKNENPGTNVLYQGSVLNSGRCKAKVSATGMNTKLGRIGRAITTYANVRTLFQKQIDQFVKRFALFGILASLSIFLINFINGSGMVNSVLFSLTLAMSAIPEEIPVAFSFFMALGAQRMSRLGIITRQSQTIENLGAVTVLCLDKTGTITENKMHVDCVYEVDSDTIQPIAAITGKTNHVLYYGVLASELSPFDSMEKAIYEAYGENVDKTRTSLKLIYEYPLEGRPPMMTHVYAGDNEFIAASKGAVERIVKVCNDKDTIKGNVLQKAKNLAEKGYRVIAVASSVFYEKDLPQTQDNFSWKLEGLIALYDPPKLGIGKVLKQFYEAGIAIKLVTGDYPETALNIARLTGIENNGNYVLGEDLMNFTEDELKEAVKQSSIFARTFPDAKVKVITALQSIESIVAMTGDGVNDGPALKAANVGIALGAKGTEVARQSADIILTDDDLGKVVEAIRQGRRIFYNFKKAVRYIISIHIPIVLTASLPLIFGWKYPNIFTPIHIIFLELIMGPTCSIFFEREPVEDVIMKLPPKKKREVFFKKEDLLITISQGLTITLAVLLLYHSFMMVTSIEYTRTVVFLTLLFSNIFLTFVTRSFNYTVFTTIHYKNKLAPVVLLLSIAFIFAIIYWPFARNIFGLELISEIHLLYSIGAACLSILWFELYKFLFKNYADQAHNFR